MISYWFIEMAINDLVFCSASQAFSRFYSYRIHYPKATLMLLGYDVHCRSQKSMLINKNIIRTSQVVLT